MPAQPVPRVGIVRVAIAVASIGILIGDLLTPVGIAVWALYLIPLWGTRWAGPRPATYVFAALVTLLIWAGYALSPPGAPGVPFISNRLIGTVVVWAGAILTVRLRDIHEGLVATTDRLRLFIEHAPAALAMFDRDMRYLAVNQRWLEEYPTGSTSILGQRHADLYPDLPAHWRAAHQRGLAGETVAEDEERFDRADGTARWLRWVIRPWHDAAGEVGGIVIFTEDITDVHQARQDLADSEARLRLALDAAQTGVYDWDLATDRITWTTWHEKLWGYQPDEFDGSLQMFEERVHPEDRTPLGDHIIRCRQERTRYTNEFRVCWPDGSIHWILGQGEFSYDDHGHPIRMRGIVRDITPSKTREEALRQSEAQLSALRARVDAMLEDDRTRISREIHDVLGQMLTGVKMDLRWAERRLDETFSEDHRINPVLERLIAATALTDETMVTVQRIAAELRPGLLDTLGIGAALEFEARRFEERTGIAVTVECPEAAPTLGGDVATALFRIAQEALTNVARHSVATQVTIALEAGPESVSLRIADNGRGATPGQLQASESLGVLGMRERARLLGGTLTVTAAPEAGVTVAVHLPTREPTVVQA